MSTAALHTHHSSYPEKDSGRQGGVCTNAHLLSYDRVLLMCEGVGLGNRDLLTLLQAHTHLFSIQETQLTNLINNFLRQSQLFAILVCAQ
jgi:hypothetical protein